MMPLLPVIWTRFGRCLKRTQRYWSRKTTGSHISATHRSSVHAGDRAPTTGKQQSRITSSTMARTSTPEIIMGVRRYISPPKISILLNASLPRGLMSTYVRMAISHLSTRLLSQGALKWPNSLSIMEQT